MKRTLRLFGTGVLALLVCLPVLAQSPEVSRLPVTEPLDVGGTILQPGNYLIRVARTPADRNKVQVLTEDGSKVVATVLTVPHYLEPGEEMPTSMFIYYPAGEGAPRALRTWFAQFPDASQGGHDIVYEESRAKQLARLAKSKVVFGRDETLSVVTPEATVETYTPPAVTTETTITQTTEADVDTEAGMVSQAPEMPSTASRVPLMALLGLAALAAALVVRMARA